MKHFKVKTPDDMPVECVCNYGTIKLQTDMFIDNPNLAIYFPQYITTIEIPDAPPPQPKLEQSSEIQLEQPTKKKG